MLWTQILYLIMVPISLLQDWNINDVPLPCNLEVAHLPWGIIPGWPPLCSLGHTWPAVQVCVGTCSTQSQLTSCFTPKCCRANSQHTGECNAGLADGLSCFTEVQELLLVRWHEQVEDRLFSWTSAHFPSYSKVFLLSMLLNSSTKSSFNRNLLSSIWLWALPCHTSTVKYSVQHCRACAGAGCQLGLKPGVVAWTPLYQMLSCTTVPGFTIP